MNILIAGIPTSDLVRYIRMRYGEGLGLFVAESRPFEEVVAREVAAAKKAGYEITICTDNMIGALMNDFEIDAVWSLYSKEEGGIYEAINGARMSAILANEHKIPFKLFHCSSFPSVERGCFAGKSVTVEGVDYKEHELDIVRADLVAEAV